MADSTEIEFARLKLLGTSPAMTRCHETIRRLARCDAPVLIAGETGTGKDLAAHALHYLGRRKAQPFIPVNCGAYPEALFQNEFFGHEKGAYTDARGPQKGLVAQAQRGTLFLDEVDTLSDRAQIVLLRFLQDQRFRPLGGGSVKQGDARIIAATNADLERCVERGQFRRDLFYRLNITALHMPPLRERIEDIPLLAQHFLRQCSARYDEAMKVLDLQSRRWLMVQPWPGNVRELESLIHREFVLTDGPSVRVAPASSSGERPDAPLSLPACAFEGGFNEAKTRLIAIFERAYLHRMMVAARGNVSLASRNAGKERRAFGRLLKKHGIDRLSYRAEPPSQDVDGPAL